MTTTEQSEYHNETILNEFHLQSKIGNGSFSTVYKASEIRSGEIFAVKRFSDTSEYYFEREILINLPYHKNVIYIGRPYEISQNYLVLVYMDETLHDFIKRKKVLNLDEQLSISAQLASGLCHCHDNYIIHRDVTVTNVLINAIGEVRLCDFGCAYKPWMGFSAAGAPYTRAPEYLLDKCLKPEFCMDMWSYGCVIVDLFVNGETEWYDFLPDGNYRNIAKTISTKGFLTIQHNRHPIIEMTLQIDPSKRATANEVVRYIESIQ